MTLGTIPLTVRVPRDIEQRLRLYATVSGRSLREIMSAALTRELDWMQEDRGALFTETVDEIRRYWETRDGAPALESKESDA